MNSMQRCNILPDLYALFPFPSLTQGSVIMFVFSPVLHSIHFYLHSSPVLNNLSHYLLFKLDQTLKSAFGSENWISENG